MAVRRSAENKFHGAFWPHCLRRACDVGARGDGVGPSSPGPDGAARTSRGRRLDAATPATPSTRHASTPPPTPPLHAIDPHHTTTQGPK